MEIPSPRQNDSLPPNPVTPPAPAPALPPIASANAGRPARARGARELFALPPRGLPEVAFLWKNLLSMRSGLSTRRAVVVMAMLGIGALIGLQSLLTQGGRGGSGRLGAAVASIALFGIVYTLLVGPQLARQDLRGDLPRADLLKTYPLAAWRIALGELLAPALILSVVLWAFLLAGTVGLWSGSPHGGAGLLPGPTGMRLLALACLCAAAPPACLVLLIAPNALLLLFPAWHATTRDRSGGGPEMFGQRLILGVLQLVVAVVALFPPLVAAALVGLASGWLLGLGGAMILSTIAFCALLAAEGAAGLAFLGWRLERLDIASEAR